MRFQNGTSNDNDLSSEVYHFGASLKDLGKKWFAFSRMDLGALDLLFKLEDIK